MLNWFKRLFTKLFRRTPKPVPCKWCHRLPNGNYVVLAGNRRTLAMDQLKLDNEINRRIRPNPEDVAEMRRLIESRPAHQPRPMVVEEMERLGINTDRYCNRL